MYGTSVDCRNPRLRRGRGWHATMARERGAPYSTGVTVPPRPTAAEAIAALDAAVAALGQVDWSAESDDAVNAAAVGLQRRVNAVNAQALRPIRQMQRRESFRADGAVTAASWLRTRAHLDAPYAARLCTAARRLVDLPVLADAFTAGDVSLTHVTTVTEAAVPNRLTAIASVEPALVELATTAPPRSLRAAIAAVRDHVDRDGSDPDPTEADPAPAGDSDSDPRRYWQHHRGIDGLALGSYCVGGVLGEMITTLFDAFSRPDPPDVAPTARRSPAQVRVDAMYAALKALLDAGLAPTVQGSKAHVLGMVDLLALMNRDQATVVAAELARSGRVSPQTIARLGIDARITPVLTMGPWRVVGVGRTHRTLPPWLRQILMMIHRRCRGPDCDRPAAWTEAHHEEGYAEGGDTDLNKTIPLCPAHHDLVTYGGWTVTLNCDTGICAWTGPDARVIQTRP